MRWLSWMRHMKSTCFIVMKVFFRQDRGASVSLESNILRETVPSWLKISLLTWGWQEHFSFSLFTFFPLALLSCLLAQMASRVGKGVISTSERVNSDAARTWTRVTPTLHLVSTMGIHPLTHSFIPWLATVKYSGNSEMDRCLELHVLIFEWCYNNFHIISHLSNKWEDKK